MVCLFMCIYLYMNYICPIVLGFPISDVDSPDCFCFAVSVHKTQTRDIPPIIYPQVN